MNLSNLLHTTRRQFLHSAGQFSLGAIALDALLGNNAEAATPNPMAPRKPHFDPTLKDLVSRCQFSIRFFNKTYQVCPRTYLLDHRRTGLP